MKFKVGQKWISRSHIVATIVKVFSDGRDFPVHGVFANSRDIQEFTADGRFSNDGEDLPGDLIELVKSSTEFVSENDYDLVEYYELLEYQFLVDGNISIPQDIRNKTATLSQALALMLDIQNNGYDPTE